MESNKTIRKNIFGDDCDFIEINDVLMGYRTITDAKMRYNIIENSADYQVVNKTNRYENSYGINGYKLKLREDLGRGQFSFKDIFVIDINNRDDLYTFAQMHDYYRDIAMENKTQWKKYYDFRRENVLLTTIDKYINGTNRPSNNIINKDMDYGYFITVHKSQGSTYNNVCILDNDLNDNWNVVERNKLRYVAMSRPTQMAYVLSNRIDE
jgi:exodeoxyribonuclease-5